ncbi:hypothetical protein LTR10_014494 [Elasticomyces elasticus]|uniref:Clr5 domain-containing protein n=1 Tax=Exophiala sideris TaxID=1016849 RepID=A0ABR0J0I9_9EURO|nr:hypothetical protein LTR10_014494 [Elasticomyces elasticus]KAK5023593.1 hypothetical protein LTS07_009101 [Exophiala sideris]KAK5029593.1 hypothetical protein LTR13_008513 [Exophiala sideris]KAK5053382.1 hypothetical protein LTR69_009340 [Exophiala sideris]KAK5179140.1 hypothetical protein LTR44_008294 [Eurotiomycetes sp. CCFEE 6388]
MALAAHDFEFEVWPSEAKELFLIRSRNHKLPYKEIANRLEKSELACRLHHHHMTVGRKGHRVEDCDEDDDDSDALSNSRSPSTTATTHFEAEPSTSQRSPYPSGGERHHLPVRNGGQSCTLPNFQSFIRDTFHHRSISSPDLITAMVGLDVEQVTDPRRGARTLSGTFQKVREDRTIYATPPQAQRATVHLPLPTSGSNDNQYNEQDDDLWHYQSGRAFDSNSARGTMRDSWARDTVGFAAIAGPHTLHASHSPSQEIDYQDYSRNDHHLR